MNTSALCGGRPLVHATAILLASQALAAFAFPPYYRVIDLGPMVSGDPNAPGIMKVLSLNNVGQVVGCMAQGDLWQGGVWQDLNVPGRPIDINDAGQVIGNYLSFIAPGVFEPAGYLYSNGAWTKSPIGPVAAISNAGPVVGGHWLWDGDTITDLDPTAQFYAVALSSAGFVVGHDGGYGRPWQWEAGTLSIVPGAGRGAAYAVNDAGTIAGGRGLWLVQWAGGTETVLGLNLFSLWPPAINAAGHVVFGDSLWYEDALYGLRDRVVSWPTTPFTATTCALDINDRDEIAAIGYENNGDAHAYFFALACTGDTNCDGVRSFRDIDKFVEALAGPIPWYNNPANAGCNWRQADVTRDGYVDFADIDGFVAALGALCP